MNNLTAYHPQGCSDLVQYLKQCCPRTEKGGIRHVALVASNYQHTLVQELDAAGSDPQAQLAAWFRAKQAQALVIVPNVLGNYDGGSPLESQGYGGAQSRVTGVAHTAVIDDVNVVGNRSFAQALMQSQRYILWFATSDLIWNTHVPAGFSVQMPVAREYTSEVRYVYTAKWSTPQPPQHYWLPTQLFDCQSFSATILPLGVNDDTVLFGATYESACADGGQIELAAVSYTDGTSTSDVTSFFTPSTASIAAASVADNFSLIDSRGPLDTGTYTFSFTISGCGLDTPQNLVVEVPVV